MGVERGFNYLLMTLFCNVDCCLHGNPRVVEGCLGYVAKHTSLVEDVSLANNDILKLAPAGAEGSIPTQVSTSMGRAEPAGAEFAPSRGGLGNGS